VEAKGGSEERGHTVHTWVLHGSSPVLIRGQSSILVLAPRGRGPFPSFFLPFVVLVPVVLSSSTTRGDVSLSVRARHPRFAPLSAAHGILSSRGGGGCRRTWDA
jgi:hypothetical protein